MAKTRKYTLREFREAIKRAGPRVTAIADALQCSSSTVYRWLRKYPELAEAHENAGGEIETRKPNYERIKAAIENSKGNMSTIAQNAGVSYSTVHNYKNEYPELAEAIKIERGKLVDLAENALAVLIAQLDGPSVRFALSTLGADRGYGNQATVKVEGLAIGAEYIEMLEKLGLEPTEAVTQFQNMIALQFERSQQSA